MVLRVPPPVTTTPKRSDKRARTRRVKPPRSHLDRTLSRMLGAIVAMALLALVGGVAYYALGRRIWGFGDCLYMSIITISTVGFGELNRMGDVPGARAVTITL